MFIEFDNNWIKEALTENVYNAMTVNKRMKNRIEYIFHNYFSKVLNERDYNTQEEIDNFRLYLNHISDIIEISFSDISYCVNGFKNYTDKILLMKKKIDFKIKIEKQKQEEKMHEFYLNFLEKNDYINFTEYKNR